MSTYYRLAIFSLFVIINFKDGRLKMHTLQTAINYAHQGKIEEWVHMFLLGEGNNIDFSIGLKLEKRCFYGPLEMPLSHFERCCGPENTMKFTVGEKSFNRNVNNIKERFESGWSMPPLIINYVDGKFELNDGNHRFEALVRSDVTNYYVIIWTTSESDMNEFIQRYIGEFDES